MLVDTMPVNTAQTHGALNMPITIRNDVLEKKIKQMQKRKTKVNGKPMSLSAITQQLLAERIEQLKAASTKQS